MVFSTLNWPVIIGASIIDGINPCAFGVLIFLLAFLIKNTKKSSTMLVNGLIYIFAVFLTYLVAGLLLLPVVQKLGQLSVWSYYAIAGIIILAGLLELKDVFWYGKGFSLSIFPSEAKRLEKYIRTVSAKKSTAFALGVFVALVELPCTGAVYLAVLALMSTAGFTLQNWTFLVVYNFIFVLPLIVILFLVYRGMSTKKFDKWRNKHKHLMRGATGLLLLALGLWMIWFIRGFGA